MKRPKFSYTNEHPMNPATLATLEKGLRAGLKIHAFRSGGGLRVVRIEKSSKLKGYGEHYAVEVALDHTAEDYLAGGRPYHDVYGEDKLYPHYLTGSSSANSRLDLVLLRGHTFDAYEAGSEIVFELHGYEDTETPAEAVELANAGGIKQWTHRGYVYETAPSNFGGGGVSTRVVSSPKGKTSGSDPWMYQVVQTGKALTLAQAIEAAFEAPSVEKVEP